MNDSCVMTWMRCKAIHYLEQEKTFCIIYIYIYQCDERMGNDKQVVVFLRVSGVSAISVIGVTPCFFSHFFSFENKSRASCGVLHDLAIMIDQTSCTGRRGVMYSKQRAII